MPTECLIGMAVDITMAVLPAQWGNDDERRPGRSSPRAQCKVAVKHEDQCASRASELMTNIVTLNNGVIS